MGRIAIVGGSIVGSSIAYHLARAGEARRVLVIEPDPTYAWAAAPRSAGGVRLMHGLPENIEMSRYGREVYLRFAELMDVDGEPGQFPFRPYGYLYLVSGGAAMAEAERTWRLQTAHGVANDLLDRAQLTDRFPALRFADVDAGLHSPEDGFVDPHAAVQGFRRKAASLGVEYVTDRVVGIEAGRGRAERVRTASGARIEVESVVNAAGAWAAEICALVGMTLPVVPLARPTFYFEPAERLDPLPLTKDPGGVSFRTEGAGFAAGYTRPDTAGGFRWEVGQDDHDLFEREMWPALARRVPAFERLRLKGSWAGHYAWNRLDGQTIIGPWTGGLENFYVAAGFSGAGLQKAPAIGRAMAELLLEGRYRTLDLSRLSYRRVVDGEPLAESGFKA